MVVVVLVLVFVREVEVELNFELVPELGLELVTNDDL